MYNYPFCMCIDAKINAKLYICCKISQLEKRIHVLYIYYRKRSKNRLKIFRIDK